MSRTLLTVLLTLVAGMILLTGLAGLGLLGYIALNMNAADQPVALQPTPAPALQPVPRFQPIQDQPAWRPVSFLDDECEGSEVSGNVVEEDEADGEEEDEKEDEPPTLRVVQDGVALKVTIDDPSEEREGLTLSYKRPGIQAPVESEPLENPVQVPLVGVGEYQFTLRDKDGDELVTTSFDVVGDRAGGAIALAGTLNQKVSSGTEQWPIGTQPIPIRTTSEVTLPVITVSERTYVLVRVLPGGREAVLGTPFAATGTPTDHAILADVISALPLEPATLAVRDVADDVRTASFQVHRSTRSEAILTQSLVTPFPLEKPADLASTITLPGNMLRVVAKPHRPGAAVTVWLLRSAAEGGSLELFSTQSASGPVPRIDVALPPGLTSETNRMRLVAASQIGSELVFHSAAIAVDVSPVTPPKPTLVIQTTDSSPPVSVKQNVRTAKLKATTTETIDSSRSLYAQLRDGDGVEIETKMMARDGGKGEVTFDLANLADGETTFTVRTAYSDTFSAPSNAVTIDVSRTPLRVATVTPTDFGTSPGVETVRVQFTGNKLTSATTVAKEQFKFIASGGDGVFDGSETGTAANEAKYDAITNVVTLTPSDDLKYPDVFRLTISKDLVDEYGNKLVGMDGVGTDFITTLGATPEAPLVATLNTSVLPPTTGPPVEFPEFTPFRKVPDGANPSDKVVTRVARLYFFRDAHRVAQIVNRRAKSYNAQSATMARQLADQARQFAEARIDERRESEFEAVEAARLARRAEQGQIALQDALRQSRLREAAAETALNDSQAARDRLAARVSLLEGSLAGGQPPEVTDQFRAQLADVQPRLAEAERLVVTRNDELLDAVANRELSERRLEAVVRTVESERTRRAESQLGLQRREAVEARAIDRQFRLEVVAAEADPDTYAPGIPNSNDPVAQVSLAVIGEGLIQLRGPIKGVNLVRTMINEIDSPVGQVRIGIHTVQVNGEDAMRMEETVSQISRHIAHSRFLTTQSAQMLRNAVVLVASRRATEASVACGIPADQIDAHAVTEHFAGGDLMHAGPGCEPPNGLRPPGAPFAGCDPVGQRLRDRMYQDAFFGRDFMAELRSMDSEFLKSGNKMISLHSMDSTSLASTLFLIGLASNSTRHEILDTFHAMLQEQLPMHEHEFFEAGLQGNPPPKRPFSFVRHKTGGQFELLAGNARFMSFRGHFDAAVQGDQTLTPVQREFVKLAQIFKSRLVTEVELKQRIVERTLIEERIGNYRQQLLDAVQREAEAEAALRSRRTKLRAQQSEVAEASVRVSAAVQGWQKTISQVEREIAQGRGSVDDNLREYLGDLDGLEELVPEQTPNVRAILRAVIEETKREPLIFNGYKRAAIAQTQGNFRQAALAVQEAEKAALGNIVRRLVPVINLVPRVTAEQAKADRVASLVQAFFSRPAVQILQNGNDVLRTPSPEIRQSIRTLSTREQLEMRNIFSRLYLAALLPSGSVVHTTAPNRRYSIVASKNNSFVYDGSPKDGSPAELADDLRVGYIKVLNLLDRTQAYDLKTTADDEIRARIGSNLSIVRATLAEWDRTPRPRPMKDLVIDGETVMSISGKPLQIIDADATPHWIAAIEALEQVRLDLQTLFRLQLTKLRPVAVEFRKLQPLLRKADFEVEPAYIAWQRIETDVENQFNLTGDSAIGRNFASVGSAFDAMLGDAIALQFAREAAAEARRPLDHKKFLDMFIDDTEEKFIELVEGTRSHIATIDGYIKRLATALDDDFQTQFYEPAFRQVREQSYLCDRVDFGQIEHTNVLANNRALAKVLPQATMEFDLPKRKIVVLEAMEAAEAAVSDYGALVADPNFLALTKLFSGQPPAPPYLNAAGPATVRDVLPGLPSQTDSALMVQARSGQPEFASQIEGLIPDPAIYKFETGTGYEIRPVIQPDGQAVVFKFDYMYTTNVREPVNADEKHLGRVKRHFINTDVQLDNYELREISRYRVALKARRTSRGVPLLEDIPAVGSLFRPLPQSEASLQQNIILGGATIFPTLFDLMGLRWAPAVADLDACELIEDEFVIRNRMRMLRDEVYDYSSSQVDEFLRIPQGDRRPDLYRTPRTVPAQHPNGYSGPGFGRVDATLQERPAGQIAPPKLPAPIGPGRGPQGGAVLEPPGHLPPPLSPTIPPVQQIVPTLPDPEPLGEPNLPATSTTRPGARLRLTPMPPESASAKRTTSPTARSPQPTVPEPSAIPPTNASMKSPMKKTEADSVVIPIL